MNEHYRAFNKDFFKKHQRCILWLLNVPLIRVWFRWVLRIRRYDCPPTESIVEITPSSYSVFLGYTRGRIKLRSDFRTHSKYGKRIYYAFRLLWWSLHLWDLTIADKFLPKLSFGFDTLTKYPDPGTGATTVDGFMTSTTYGLGSGVDWATLYADAGNVVNNISDVDVFVSLLSDNVQDKWRQMKRAGFTFDTSSLTADVSISAAVLSVKGDSQSDSLTVSPTLNIFSFSPGLDDELVAGDFDALGTTEFATDITYAAYSVSQYNDFTFNATGIAAVNKIGISRFGLRESTYDAPNSSPTWGSSKSYTFGGYYADAIGTANDPKLVVTYTIPGSTVKLNMLLGLGQ